MPRSLEEKTAETLSNACDTSTWDGWRFGRCLMSYHNRNQEAVFLTFLAWISEMAYYSRHNMSAGMQEMYDYAEHLDAASVAYSKMTGSTFVQYPDPQIPLF